MASLRRIKLNPLILSNNIKLPTSPPTSPLSVLSPNEIIKHLYLSSGNIASNKEELEKYKIKGIINVTKDIPCYYETTIKYLRIPIDDSIQTEISKYFEDAHKFIDEHINKGESILVHCKAGISRSATIIISYLMKKQKIKYNESIEIVRKKRKKIDPNLGFCSQLLKFEKYF